MQTGIITAIEAQQRNKERVNVYLDGVYAFSLQAIEAAHLQRGQQLTPRQIAQLRDADALHQAVDRAVRFLAYRPRSTHEVRSNLARHGTPEPVIDLAVDRLTSLGYLDDHAFARFWVENRGMFKPMSPRALRYELQRKGVPDAAISAALEPVDVIDAAYRAARERARRLRGATHHDFTQKLGAFLQRRGFSYATCRDVLDRLAEELTADDPAFFAAHEGDDFA